MSMSYPLRVCIRVVDVYFTLNIQSAHVQNSNTKGNVLLYVLRSMILETCCILVPAYS